MSLIFAGSTGLMSAQHTSRIIGPVLRWFNPQISDQTIYEIQFYVRKAGHATEYAVLSLLLWRARRQAVGERKPWSWNEARFAVLISALYAATDEFHQHFVATRMASVWDVLLDTSGAVAAMLLLWRIGLRRNWW